MLGNDDAMLRNNDAMLRNGDTSKKAAILIVEDNEIDFQIAEIMLKKVLGNIIIDWCQNGEEAFSYLYDLKSGLPDLILLDIDMPIMNGKEFLKLRSRNNSFRNIPVIVLSSSVWDNEKEECLKLGAINFIEKPLGVDAINNTVKLYTFIRTNTDTN